MKEVCGWAGRTGSHSGIWPARASGCSTCPMTCPRPCATSRWSDAGCGSRPTAGWCASRVRRRGDNEERSEEHTSELQSQSNLVCRLLLEKKKKEVNESHLYTHTSVVDVL